MVIPFDSNAAESSAYKLVMTEPNALAPRCPNISIQDLLPCTLDLKKELDYFIISVNLTHYLENLSSTKYLNPVVKFIICKICNYFKSNN